MNVDPFHQAERVADAVLYEGYLLYPYRASSAKNRVRWQFGTVMPPAFAEYDDSERSALQAECLLGEVTPDATIHLRLRFLQVNSREVHAPGADGGFAPVSSLDTGDETLAPWDEGIPRTIERQQLRVSDLLSAPCSQPVLLPELRSGEMVLDGAGAIRGRVVRHARRLTGCVRILAEAVGSWIKLQVRVENHTPWPDGLTLERAEAARYALLGTHLLLHVSGARFISLIDPPVGAARAVESCGQEGLWPSLIGSPARSDILLCSPIILGDYPTVAPESPGDLCDATEIDEILTLRIRTMTDDEKREARATDARAREIVDRSESLGAADFADLHGARRDEQEVSRDALESFLNPAGDARPEEATLEVDGITLSRGAHVQLRPTRRADPMDMFLEGRDATVAGIFRDVEDRAYVAVTIDDDPGADLHDGVGRYFYFYPDELVLQTEVRS